MSELLSLIVSEQAQRGAMPLADFLTVAGALSQVSREVNEVINLDHEEPIFAELVIVAVHSGSVALELRMEDPPAAPYAVAREVTTAVFNGIELLERTAKRPPYFPDSALRAVEQFVKPLHSGVSAIRLLRPDREVTLTARIGEHVREILAPRSGEVTSVEGVAFRLHMGRREFGLYDTRRKQVISCRYPPGMFEEVRALLGHRVLVFGKAQTGASGDVRRIDARVLRRLSTPESRRSLADLFGSDPGFTGGMDSVTYVRAHRGEETSDD